VDLPFILSRILLLLAATIIFIALVLLFLGKPRFFINLVRSVVLFILVCGFLLVVLGVFQS